VVGRRHVPLEKPGAAEAPPNQTCSKNADTRGDGRRRGRGGGDWTKQSRLEKGKEEEKTLKLSHFRGGAAKQEDPIPSRALGATGSGGGA